MPNTVCHLFPTIEFITSHEGTSTSTADDIMSLYHTPTEDHLTICIEEQATSDVGPKDLPDLTHDDLISSPWFSNKDNIFLDICSITPSLAQAFQATAVVLTEMADTISAFADGTVDQESNTIAPIFWIALMI
jgi:hypothetical protein